MSVDSSDIPVTDSKESLFVLPLISSLVQVEEEHKDKSLANLIKIDFPKSQTVVYEPKAKKEDILEQIKNYKASKIIFMTYNGHLFTDQIEAAKEISQKIPNTIMIALRNPYDIFECDFSKTKGATFGFRTPAIKALLSVLKGKKQPSTNNWPVKTNV